MINQYFSVFALKTTHAQLVVQCIYGTNVFGNFTHFICEGDRFYDSVTSLAIKWVDKKYADLDFTLKYIFLSINLRQELEENI